MSCWARDVSAVGVLASVALSVAAVVVGVWPIIAAVVLNGPAAVAVGVLAVGVLVAVPVPAVVIALVAAAIPAGVFAASVLSWVCESGVVSQGWVGELVEGWSGCGVDGALWGAG